MKPLIQNISCMVLCIFVYASITTTYAQQNTLFQFEHIKNEQGPLIYCILQDGRGFLWVGTNNGLNKYDGYTFTNYKHDSADPNSLNSNNISAIYEDKEGIIWIGTHRGGLNKFNRETEQFTHFTPDPSNSNSINDNIIYEIAESREGKLWIATEHGGLNRFDKTSETFQHYIHDPANTNSLSHNIVRTVYEDSKGVVWVGTFGGGLNKITFRNGIPQFTHYRHNPSDPSSIGSDKIWVLHEDEAGTLWIGTFGNGLDKMDKKTGVFTHYLYDPDNPNSISWNYILSICETDPNTLWVGTTRGLNKFDKKTRIFQQFKNDPLNPQSINDNQVSSIYQDKEGVIWIGTQYGGLNKLDIVSKKFLHYKPDPNDPNSLNGKLINALYEDSSNNLWIGTEKSGLNKLDKKSGKFSHYKHDPTKANSSSKNNVVSIMEDSKGNLWIGTDIQTLHKFNKKTATFSHYPVNSMITSSIKNGGRILSIYEDRQGILWIGLNGAGLIKLTIDDDDIPSFTLYTHDVKNPAGLKPGSIYSIIEDIKGIIWLGTTNGLVEFDTEKDIFIRYQHDSNKPNSVSNNLIYSLLVDSQGRFWIGTEAGGLNLFNRSTKTFSHYNEKNGLPDDTVLGILEDKKGYLWISTENGITRFDPEKVVFKNYDIKNGLQNNKFRRGAYYKNKEGMMYFGGINGFNVFHPDSIRDNTYLPTVRITDFQLFNKPVSIRNSDKSKEYFELEKHISETNEIILTHAENVFSFEFAALSYSLPEKNKYAYKLENFDKDWNYVDFKHRNAIYTNISHGEYTFRVKASNSEGYWNEEGASIKVIILPPWWLTLWAKVLYVLAGLGVIFTLIRNQQEKLNRKERELKKERHTTAKLRNAYTDLKELEEFKEAMTGMIVHDFKNALNTVISFSDGIPSKRRLKSIRQAGRHMLHMVLNILDVQKFEKASINLRLTIDPIDKVVKEALERVSFLIEQKSLKLVLQLGNDLFSRFDFELISRVIINILTNAIKYTEANGSIHIQAEKQDEFIKLDIRDTGQGIPADKLHLVFDKFFSQVQTNNKAGEVRSTGLGLSFCKMVVEAHGGEIGVESTQGQGSNFYFTIPLTEPIEEQKPLIEKIDVQDDQPIMFSEKEKELLKPFLNELQQWEVYDYSEVTAIINKVNTGNTTIDSWKEKMINALHNVNEEQYNELVNID